MKFQGKPWYTLLNINCALFSWLFPKRLENVTPDVVVYAEVNLQSCEAVVQRLETNEFSDIELYSIKTDKKGGIERDVEESNRNFD